MSVASFAVSHTLGVVLPKYRTLGQWSSIYDQIISGLPITDKTKANRRCSMAHVLRGLGRDRIISGIRPHDVSAFLGRIHKDHPPLAKRVLIETKAMFSGALDYGWVDRSPADQVKAQRVTVARNRLTLWQWKTIHTYAIDRMPPWVSRMMVLALVTGQRRSDLVKMKFSDVWDGHLHIEQAKTGTRLALPMALRLDAIGTTLSESIEDCRSYAKGDEYLLRKSTGERPGDASLSARFEEAREAAIALPKTGACHLANGKRFSLRRPDCDIRTAMITNTDATGHEQYWWLFFFLRASYGPNRPANIRRAPVCRLPGSGN